MLEPLKNMKNIHREFAPHFQKWAATMVIIGHYELVSGVVKMVVGNGEGLNLSLRGIRTSALWKPDEPPVYSCRPTFGF